jgi:hypothetical protein
MPQPIEIGDKDQLDRGCRIRVSLTRGQGPDTQVLQYNCFEPKVQGII